MTSLNGSVGYTPSNKKIIIRTCDAWKKLPHAHEKIRLSSICGGTIEVIEERTRHTQKKFRRDGQTAEFGINICLSLTA